MDEAVLAQATGWFHERLAPARLRKHFASTWVHRMHPTSAPPVVITPDATVDLQWLGGSFRIAGPDKAPQTEILPAGAVVVGLRFHPASAAAWLGVPLTEIASQRVALDDLWGARARRLSNQVRQHHNLEDLVHSIMEVVAQEAASHDTDVSMQAAFALIERGPSSGQPLIPWLMHTLEMSERTIRRRFDESFGYGPKTLDRIMRYQRFLKLSNQSRSCIAALATEAGYSDQAHLVRESRRMTGSTPRRILEFLQTR